MKDKSETKEIPNQSPHDSVPIVGEVRRDIPNLPSGPRNPGKGK